MNTNQMPLPVQLMKMIIAKWISKPIYLAAKLGIADLLAKGPQTIEALAKTTSSKPELLYRVMRALASVGIFREEPDRQFGLTPMAELLQSNMLRSATLLFNAEWDDQAWLHFPECIASGETPFKKAHGTELPVWLKQNPAAAEIFNQANAIKATASQTAIINAYDFSQFHTITDVGGGTGALMIEILKAYPHLKGRVADLREVTERAQQHIDTSDINKRCETISIDFFKTVPAGSDCYLLSNILHDWPDQASITILQNCCQAMSPKAKLLIAEMVIEPGNEPSIAKLLDLEMFVINGGKERTEKEFKELVEGAGLSLAATHPTAEGVTLLECTKKA